MKLIPAFSALELARPHPASTTSPLLGRRRSHFIPTTAFKTCHESSTQRPSFELASGCSTYDHNEGLEVR